MLDLSGSGIEYERQDIEKFTKVLDLFTNDNRFIYAELLRDNEGNLIYFREWFSSNDSNSSNFRIIKSLDELKIELKKDIDHGDLAPGKLSKILDEAKGKLDIN